MTLRIRSPRTSLVFSSLSALASLGLGACALRPWTPSESAAYWPPPIPAVQATPLPTFAEAAAKWALAPSVTWARYQKLTLLGALDELPEGTPMPATDHLQVVIDAEDAAESLAKQLIPRDTMIVLDLRGAASVALAARVTQRSAQLLAPVMTFNHWPAEDEVIPAEETLAALVTHTPKLPLLATGGDVDATPIFMLDSWRLAYRYSGVDDETTDNRYMLTTADLPSAQDLAAKGIRRVLYVVESLSWSGEEEDDLNASFLAYQADGISIHMVDLEWLRALAGPVDWTAKLAPRLLNVVPRETLVDDPSFYSAAHGGFGGIYAVPFQSGPWGGHSGHVGTVG